MRSFLILLLASCAFGAELHRIVVDRFVPNEMVLYVARADGTEEKPLLTQPGGLDYNPTYSVDGKWVAFTSERNGSADLYRVKDDGTGLERLTDNPAYDDQAAFSTNGRQIAFVSSRDGGHSNLWILDVATHKTKRLTKGVWGDFRPAWSPDNKWIAFSSDRQTPYLNAKGRWEQLHLIDVYVIQPDGSGLRRLTKPGGACGSPKWSRDGRQLVAYCMTAQESFDNRPGNPSGTSRLVSIDVATGTMTDLPARPGVKMAPAFVAGSDVGYVRKDAASPGIFYTGGKAGPSGIIRSPSWSADGSHVVYHKILGNLRINGKKVWSREPDFEFRLASEIPAFNKTGDQYLSSQNVKGIWNLNVVETTTGKERLLYKEEGKSVMAGQWSPQGDAIAFGMGNFFANRDRGAQVVMVNPDGSGFRQLTSGANNNNYPSYSPDGKQIVYRTMGPEGQGLRVMNLADKSVRKLTNDYDNFPGWSPRGDLILFTRKVDPVFQIFTIRPDGTDLRQLTFSPANEGHAVWSPDGGSILLLSARMGFKDEVIYLDGQQPQGEMFVMRSDGTQVRQLTDNQWEDGTAAWQPEPAKTSSR
jgi:Tol biopolymer transport system component